MVVGFLGYEIDGGEFHVQEICFPKPIEPQKSLVFRETPSPMIAIISGLSIGKDSGYNLSMQLLLDYLSGELGTPDDQEWTRRITKLVITGNSVQKLSHLGKDIRNKFGTEVASFDASPLRLFDTLLYQIASSMDVDLMPGPSDPANAFLPQQPMHSCMFPKSCHLSSLKTVTNPHSFEVNETHILASSGQNLNDIFKYTDSYERLDLVQSTLDACHIAPTAPDTLWCHPYSSSDPFILNKKPHVYIVGNQPQFETRKVEDSHGNQTRIILVPPFHSSATLVLLDTYTLETRTVVLSHDVDDSIGLNEMKE